MSDFTNLSVETLESETNNHDQNHESIYWTYFCEFLTVSCQLCIYILVTFFLYLCLNEEIVLFTWHPLLFTVGWLLLMMQAVLSISTYNSAIMNCFNYINRIRSHWILQVLGALLWIPPFIIIIVIKNQKNKAHFTSWHGLLGLIAVIFACFTFINGIMALYRISLRQYLSPRINKMFHIFNGFVVIILGGCVMITSLGTGWFKRKTHDQHNIYLICYIVIIFITICCLIGPIIKLIRR